MKSQIQAYCYPKPENIKKLIKQNDFSIIYVANQLGISRDKMNRILSGKLKKGIHKDMLLSLSNILKCTPDYLMGLSSSPIQVESGNLSPAHIDTQILMTNAFYELSYKEPRLFEAYSYIMLNFTKKEKQLLYSLVDVINMNHQKNGTEHISEQNFLSEYFTDEPNPSVKDLSNSDICKK